MANQLEKKIARKKAKRDQLQAEYNSLNRHDFSGSWADRIRNNTGPQLPLGNMTREECSRQYEANVKVKLMQMNKYNAKTIKKIEELDNEIKQLEGGLNG